MANISEANEHNKHANVIGSDANAGGTVGGQHATSNITESFVTGFNLNEIRINQDFANTFGVKKVFTSIPIRAPRKDEFFRIHPSKEFQIAVVVIELKEDNEIYVVSPALAGLLPGLARPAFIFAAVDRNGNPFLPFVYLPGPDGKSNPWHESRMRVYEKAQTCWIRSVANKALQGYEILMAEGLKQDPAWPDLTFGEMIEIALRGRYIDSEDHAVVKQLRGLA